jgi:hypothetical protein
MEQWSFTTDTGMAAAFGTLGMPVHVFKGMLETEGKVRARFGIGLTDVERKYKTKALQSAIRSGKLQHTTPDHPLCVILRAFHNREALLDLANKGRAIRLVKIPRAETFRYEPSDTGLPGVKRGDAILRTGDLKLASALATIGLPILAIEGPRHQHVFSIQAADHIHNGVELMHAWRAKPEAIPWSHPFAQAMRGLHNRERLLDAIHRAGIKITLTAPNGRAAIVTADAQGNTSAAAMDAASDFLD